MSVVQNPISNAKPGAAAVRSSSSQREGCELPQASGRLTWVDQQFARWVMLHVQSNPLPICTRPRVLIKGKRT